MQVFLICVKEFQIRVNLWFEKDIWIIIHSKSKIPELSITAIIELVEKILDRDSIREVDILHKTWRDVGRLITARLRDALLI